MTDAAYTARRKMDMRSRGEVGVDDNRYSTPCATSRAHRLVPRGGMPGKRATLLAAGCGDRHRPAGSKENACLWRFPQTGRRPIAQASFALAREASVPSKMTRLENVLHQTNGLDRDSRSRHPATSSCTAYGRVSRWPALGDVAKKTAVRAFQDGAGNTTVRFPSGGRPAVTLDQPLSIRWFGPWHGCQHLLVDDLLARP